MRKLLVVLAAVLLSVLLAPTAVAQRFPDRIPLPNGFFPEGIAIGKGTAFYVGSLATGAIYRGDLRTGRGAVLAPGDSSRPRRSTIGLEVDSRERVWVAGGVSGDVRVHDGRTGALLAVYPVTARPNPFVNDLVVTDNAVYATDSAYPELHVIPLRHGGGLPDPSAAHTVPLSGPAADPDFNNGVESTMDGQLVIVNRVGELMKVNPRTGASALVDLGGYLVTNGDGLVRRGNTLYVVRNMVNTVSVLRLDPHATQGTLLWEVTSPALRIPTTGDLFGSSLYVVNARFDTPPGPDVDYDVVRLPA
ncbi:hypothetical protein EV193_116110 [Herbihabitans rhizosphaerae]|uniref:Sugar lactone lactonase YvrE n=1 Tax=Herbihabitans rhizosphaerae TaxID=1872711 RepID=A0A4Q7KDY6_9PSEU|nr:superoxide dismutase [Herbihabitans rhizosphaerae]RZS30589.1 hypothetical protein EV193_116110 [Herbihabitans rhizosphaerae]